VGKVLVMKQQTLAMAADQSFEQYRKPTRRDAFLRTMEALVPWVALRAVIELHYPKAGNGRPPIGLERMLRIHFIQHGFNLADLSCEEALFAQVGAALQSKAKASKSTPASSWMAPSLAHPAPPRTQTKRVTP
jgi:hypothetical protein